MAEHLIVYWDGSCGPVNPGGTAAYGFLVKNDNSDVIHQSSGRVGTGPDMTNNVGEYEGLYQAMLYIKQHHPDAIVDFYGDSSLIVAQMTGEAKARKGKYLPYYHKTIELAQPYIDSRQWSVHWIQRALNSEADELAQYQRF